MTHLKALVGNNIKRLRKSKGLTQEYLASQADVSASYIGYLERGQKSPSLELIEQLAQVLDVQPAQLLKSAEDHENPELVKLMTLLSHKESYQLKFINDVTEAYFRSLKGPE